jgi:hypothetical protein
LAKYGSFCEAYYLKKLLFTVVFFVLSLNVSVLANGWNEQKGTHFIVYYTGTNDSFAQKVLQRGESEYSRIANYFGYTRSSSFWTWDNRVKIYIYPSHKAYLRARNMTQWSEGMADYNKKEIASFVKSEYFIESILPHEIAHLIFRDFVGFKGEVPLWLDEGVAQWAELENRTHVSYRIKRYLEEKKILSFETMMKLDVQNITYNQTVNISFLLDKSGSLWSSKIRGSEFVKIYYVQAASIVSFLIERYGTDRFAIFCRGLRDGSSLNKALRQAYPVNVDNMQALQKVWLEYIQE